MTVYGYARVSTPTQSIDRQLINISKSYPEVTKIYKESFTGTRIDRPQFSKLLRSVRSGDSIVFDSVSRMSRTALEGWELYKKLYSDGINLIFLKEPYVNTDNYKQALNISLPVVPDKALEPLMSGIEQTLMLLAERQFYQAFEQSEKEVQDLRQRTREGMRASGAGSKIAESRTGKKYQTVKSVKAKQRIKQLSKSFDGNMKDSEVIELIGISQAQYYRYKKELREETK